MANTSKADAMKQVFKEALTETFHEQRDFLREIFAEAIEDVAMIEAIREGPRTAPARGEEVFRVP